jgi:hypothetical protein
MSAFKRRTCLHRTRELPRGCPYRDLGPAYYDDRISTERKIRNHVRQLEALGLTLTITPAEDAA